MAGRLEEVEEQALRHGKKIIAKLEERVRAMEGDLGEYSNYSGSEKRELHPSCLCKMHNPLNPARQRNKSNE